MCADCRDGVRFQAKARRDVYVDLSADDFEECMCGLLKKAVYETRDAAQNWEMEFSDIMAEEGFR